MKRALFLVLAACAEQPALLVVPQAETSAVPTATTLPPVAAPKPPPPAEEDPLMAVRDPRRPPRRNPVSAIEGEMHANEMLLRTLPPGDPKRPEALHRLIDLCAEAERGSRTPGLWRNSAIKHASTLLASFPTYAKLDEVMYFAALAFEKNSDLSNARRTYLELIMKYPSSKYVPFAYFAFGEIFFQEAESDPTKYAPARQAFDKVMQSQTDRELLAYAVSRMASIYEKINEPKKAEEMKKVLYGEFAGTRAAR